MSRPETRTAFLVNSQGQATVHRFHHSEIVFDPPEWWVGRWSGGAELHVFECEETGERRRYGVDAIDAPEPAA